MGLMEVNIFQNEIIKLPPFVKYVCPLPDLDQGRELTQMFTIGQDATSGTKLITGVKHEQLCLRALN